MPEIFYQSTIGKSNHRHNLYFSNKAVDWALILEILDESVLHKIISVSERREGAEFGIFIYGSYPIMEVCHLHILP